MREVILNEKLWAEAMIEKAEFGPRPVETFSRIARYYYSEGYRKSEIPTLLEQYLLRCDPNVSITKWQNVIDVVSKKCDKYPLIDIAGVPVTDQELERIKELKGKLRQKVMFALLCLAKYSNMVNPKNNNWANFDSSAIFMMANVTITNRRKALLINELRDSGHVGFSRYVDNINLNIRIIDNRGEPRLLITDFRNLGNQYLRYIGEAFIECESCGLVIKRSAPNQKYCSDCAAGVNRDKSRERMRSYIIDEMV